MTSLFAPAPHGGRLLDPCAGEGRALQHLSDAWRLTPYANELDTDRAAECQARFGPIQAVQGDLYTLRASLGSFSALWCNPPYTWEMGSGDEKRREFAMLKHAWKWVQPGGYVLLGGVRAPRHAGRSGVPGETQPGGGHLAAAGSAPG